MFIVTFMYLIEAIQVHTRTYATSGRIYRGT